MASATGGVVDERKCDTAYVVEMDSTGGAIDNMDRDGIAAGASTGRASAVAGGGSAAAPAFATVESVAVAAGGGVDGLKMEDVNVVSMAIGERNGGVAETKISVVFDCFF